MNSHFQFGSARPRPRSDTRIYVHGRECTIWPTMADYIYPHVSAQTMHSYPLIWQTANCHEMVRVHFHDLRGKPRMRYEKLGWQGKLLFEDGFRIWGVKGLPFELYCHWKWFLMSYSLRDYIHRLISISYLFNNNYIILKKIINAQREFLRQNVLKMRKFVLK